LAQQQQQRVASALQEPAVAAVTAGSSGAAAAAAGIDISQQQQQSDGVHADREKAAERLARRKMYPAGRILHFLPATVVATALAGKVGNAEKDPGLGSSSNAAECSAEQQRQLPRLTAVSGTAGLGDNYSLLEVADVEVYGRMRLNPAMVRDHFIPSYLKAVDNVIGQLMIQIGGTAADELGEALCM
jgi:hypothetical protein